ncbi:GMP reductase [Fangia hongkongensis]|uniref:GMP reductase n=1 Tax=Fangia hongkongensis TaxID=270495 RepID=UPI000369D07E|nr:GMP reductase [Fangia hongkongensis]MBK2124504.1 GMP reductase [Fangia hongkongensis]
MRIEQDIKLGFQDVLIRPKRSTLKSRSQVSLERNFTFKHSKKAWEGVPIVAANMDSVASFAMAEALAKHKVLTAIHKHYSVKDWEVFLSQADKLTLQHMMISTGTSKKDFDKLTDIVGLSPDLQFICIDIANGYSEHLVDFVASVRARFPEMTISAGNVVTGDMVEELVLAGSDIVKVGIGPGSVCTTRVKTGVGYPQLSAIIECADAAHGLGGRIIGDGGCTCAGDVAKAFGGGADFVMLGGMLAGHSESGGEVIEKEGKKYVKFYGMSSKSAMDKYAGSVAAYRAAEGKTVHLPYKGKVDNTVQDILGGVRSACTYVGAKHLKELTKRTTFIRVQEQENNVYGKE